MTGEVLDGTKQDMEKTVAAFRKELSHVRTGRASTALLEGITVDYYGTKTPLNQVATLSAPEASLLVVQPYDKSVIVAIEKAIRSSDLGLNPNSDGKVIHLNLPPLNEERRRGLVKQVHVRLEEARVAIRNIRRDVHNDMREYEKEKLISEDELKRGEDELQKLTDRFVEDVAKHGQIKEKEIMEV